MTITAESRIALTEVTSDFVPTVGTEYASAVAPLDDDVARDAGDCLSHPARRALTMVMITAHCRRDRFRDLGPSEDVYIRRGLG